MEAKSGSMDLRYLWVMRYEAKHSTLKQIASRARNRINVCKTLAKKHQRISAIHLSETDFMSPSSLKDFKPCSELIEDDSLMAFANAENGSVGLSVRVNGVKYGQRDVVVLSGEDDVLTFGSVRFVIMCPDQRVILYVNVLASEYDAHLNAFHVTMTDIHRLVALRDLADHHTLRMYARDGRHYVVMLYYVR